MFSLIHFLHPCFPLPSSLSHSPALPSPPPLHLCSPPASPHLLSPSILPASLPSSSPAAPIEMQRNADAGISFSISLLSPLKFLLCPAPPAPPTQASPPPLPPSYQSPHSLAHSYLAFFVLFPPLLCCCNLPFPLQNPSIHSSCLTFDRGKVRCDEGRSGLELSDVREGLIEGM